MQERTFEKTLQFVFEADLVVGDRPEAEQAQERFANAPGHAAGKLREAIGPVGEVAAKKFVGAFAAEGDCDSFAAETGEEPDRNRAGIGEGFVGIVDDAVDSILEIQRGIQVELVMLRPIMFCNGARGAAFIKGAAGESDGVSAYGRVC